MVVINQNLIHYQTLNYNNQILMIQKHLSKSSSNVLGTYLLFLVNLYML